MKSFICAALLITFGAGLAMADPVKEQRSERSGFILIKDVVDAHGEP